MTDPTPEDLERARESVHPGITFLATHDEIVQRVALDLAAERERAAPLLKYMRAGHDPDSSRECDGCRALAEYAAAATIRGAGAGTGETR